MPFDSPSNLPKITAAAQMALDRMLSTVALASGMTAAGRAVDLAGLEQAAGTLCAQVLDLPPAESLAFRIHLVDLHGRLSRLAAQLRQAAP